MTSSVPCNNPTRCRVQTHLLTSGASAKCGATGLAAASRVGAKAKMVDMRVPALVGAGSGGGMSSLTIRPARSFSPAQWADMRDDLVSERAAQMIEGKNPNLTVEQRNAHNYTGRGLDEAIAIMDEVDECDGMELSRQIGMEVDGSYVPGKRAGLLLALEMLKH